MDHLEKVKGFITHIKTAKSIEDWQALLRNEHIALFKKSDQTYPPIAGLFKNEDLKDKLAKIEINNLSTVTEKILYAVLWKNGDLLKVAHVINGLNLERSTSPTAITFHQFGQFLAAPDENPIIDQHVIRAFRAVQEKDSLDMVTLMKIAKSGPLHATRNGDIIKDYINWVKEKHAGSMDCTPAELFYAIDDIMFAFGRWIKSFSKPKGQTFSEE